MEVLEFLHGLRMRVSERKREQTEDMNAGGARLSAVDDAAYLQRKRLRGAQ
jgi:hypothetical protein